MNFGLDGWKLGLIGELCLGWFLELFGWRNFVIWWRFEGDMKVFGYGGFIAWFEGW